MQDRADKTRGTRMRALLEHLDLWLFPASFVALALALALLWYANSNWRNAARAPEVQIGELTELPAQPQPSPKRP